MLINLAFIGAGVDLYIIMLVFFIIGLLLVKKKTTVIFLGVLTLICEICSLIETPEHLAGTGVAVIQMWAIVAETIILPLFIGSLIPIPCKRKK
ncbi:MAG: hypothetical protein GX363_06345 [Clostridiales bacterium]|nr:hypothetical protein [Clostridiales bacterium]